MAGPVRQQPHSARSRKTACKVDDLRARALALMAATARTVLDSATSQLQCSAGLRDDSNEDC